MLITDELVEFFAPHKRGRRRRALVPRKPGSSGMPDGAGNCYVLVKAVRES